MHIVIGITRAVVAKQNKDQPQQSRTYQDLGVGEYTYRIEVDDRWDPNEQFVTVLASMQHHKHPEGYVAWIECPDDMLRTLLMRHFNTPEENVAAPVNWGQPKPDEGAEPEPEPEPEVEDEAKVEVVETEPQPTNPDGTLIPTPDAVVTEEAQGA